MSMGLRSSQGKADLEKLIPRLIWSVSDSFPAREGQSHEQSSEETGGQELALVIFPIYLLLFPIRFWKTLFLSHLL